MNYSAGSETPSKNKNTKVYLLNYPVREINQASHTLKVYKEPTVSFSRAYICQSHYSHGKEGIIHDLVPKLAMFPLGDHCDEITQHDHGHAFSFIHSNALDLEVFVIAEEMPEVDVE